MLQWTLTTPISSPEQRQQSPGLSLLVAEAAGEVSCTALGALGALLGIALGAAPGFRYRDADALVKVLPCCRFSYPSTQP